MLQNINFAQMRVVQLAASAAIPRETDVVTIDASSGPVTVTLPSPRLPPDSRLGIIHILKTDESANPVTIATPNGEIVGKTSLPSQHASAMCMPSGAGQWFIF